VECDNRVGSELRLKNSPAAVAWLPAILDAGVQVMLFAGAEDLICNYKGIENLIERLEWAEGKGFMVSLGLRGSVLERADGVGLIECDGG
jgi:carboxypeptidase D